MSVPVNEEHRINMVMKVKGWIRHNQPNLFNFLTNSNKREQEYGHRIGGDGTKLLSEKQYDKIHRQMRIKKGHPDHCERCGKKSYNYDLANIDHQYSNSVADYKTLKKVRKRLNFSRYCVRCGHKTSLHTKDRYGKDRCTVYYNPMYKSSRCCCPTKVSM